MQSVLALDSHGAMHQVVQRSDANRETIQVVEERAVITKHRKLTGGVRVRTVVHEDEAIVDEPLGTEQVEIARVPLDRWWKHRSRCGRRAIPRSSPSTRR